MTEFLIVQENIRLEKFMALGVEHIELKIEWATTIFLNFFITIFLNILKTVSSMSTIIRRIHLIKMWPHLLTDADSSITKT